MSKIRVYELAKELGLENKVVLDLCESLSVEGKKSHSSTLSDDEADRIRRSVLRQAVSDREGTVRRIEKEGSVLTEQRMGNVIRRRKKSAEELEEEAERAPQIDLTDLPKTSIEIPKLAPDHHQERSARAEALARANALFAERPAAVMAEKPAGVPPEQVPAEAAPAVPVENGPIAADTPELRSRSEVRGAKVLGRIDLPQRPEPSSPRREEPSAEGAAADPDSSRLGKGVKRKVQVAGEEFADYERPAQQKRKKQVVISKVDLVDYDEEHDGWRHRRDRRTRRHRGEGGDSAARQQKRTLKIDGEISVGEFAKAMSVKVTDVIAKLMSLGVMASINQLIDFDTAHVVGEEFGVIVVNVGRDDEVYLQSLRQQSGETEIRPPVVTVMGHVDHGKTSLLDAIRETSVTEKEAGGITQHIGAYNVLLPSGGSVTFLDTPGHEAFTAMRMRGAKVTDIVVLVVAADDGVMPQTLEALNHAKAAGVAIIVAVTKIDKESANVERVKTQLSEHGLIPEDWGGETIFVGVSARTRVGLDLLLDNLYAQAEVLELKANPNRSAYGTVIESKIDRGRGPVVTVLVQDGMLRRGDSFVCGSVSGRVRALVSSSGEMLESAGPSIPVEVLGADDVPLAGEDFYVLGSEGEAREIAEKRLGQVRARELAGAIRPGSAGPFTLENFSEMVAGSTVKELPVIVKGDVQGSVEAVAGALNQLSTDNVRVRVIHRGAGAVTENDVQLASASRALVIGFNVRADSRATAIAEAEGVRIAYSRVIYELVDAVKQYLLGMEEPEIREATLGRAEVRQIFKLPRAGVVAGSYVIDGTVQRGAQLRLLRDNRIVYEGKMSSLRRFKDDVREVAAGYECGIGIEGYNDIKAGDIIEAYRTETVQRGSDLFQ